MNKRMFLSTLALFPFVSLVKGEKSKAEEPKQESRLYDIKGIIEFVKFKVIQQKNRYIVKTRIAIDLLCRTNFDGIIETQVRLSLRERLGENLEEYLTYVDISNLLDSSKITLDTYKKVFLEIKCELNKLSQELNQ